MRRFCCAAVLMLAASLSSVSGLAQTAAPAVPPMNLKVGDAAPDFTMRDQTGKEVSLKDFRGKKSVVLAFYVFAFTGG